MTVFDLNALIPLTHRGLVMAYGQKNMAGQTDKRVVYRLKIANNEFMQYAGD